MHHELATELEKSAENHEILYLVATSAKEVVAEAQRIRAQDPARVRVLLFSDTVGTAGMLSAGIEHSRGEILITIQSGFEVSFAIISDLIAALRSDADLVSAARSRSNVPRVGRIQAELFNKLVSLASGRRFRDITSGTRAMRREVATATPLYGDFYRYLPLLADRLGFIVREIPAPQHPRASTSWMRAPQNYLWRATDLLSILFISRFTRSPLRLFGAVGSVFAGTGAMILAVAVAQRFGGTPLADRPVLVLGTLLVGLGVQAFTIGLLGELILFYHARSIRDYRVAAVYEADSPPLER